MPLPLPERTDLSGPKKRRWYGRLLTAALRAAPGYIYIGAPRSGSTSLFHHLNESPLVLSSFFKEVSFFDRNHHHGAGWYRAHFPLKWEIPRGAITGEATPSYLRERGAPERVKAVAPNARFLVLLRNPADRAISAYHHTVKRGLEPLTIDEALDPESDWVSNSGLFDTPGPAEPRPDRKSYYLGTGRYGEQLENWFRVFPREQFLIQSSEAFLADTAGGMKRVFEFLGLPPVVAQQYERRHELGYQRPSSALRDRLIEYFRPHNQRTYEVMGVDYGWDS